MELLKLIGQFFGGSSISILAIGVLMVLVQKHYEHKNWLLAYLSCLLLTESLAWFIAVHLNMNNLFIFVPAFFVQLLFLTHFYCFIVFKQPVSTRNWILGLGLLPFLIFILPEPYFSFLKYYNRVPYSLTIMLYSLSYFFALVSGKLASIPSRNLLNGAVLLFFTLDLFYALGTKFLMTESLLLFGAVFWTIRVLFLQLFYVVLIYYGWKSSKGR
jgi:hypothetical protein